jgi:hypothetical protein
MPFSVPPCLLCGFSADPTGPARWPDPSAAPNTAANPSPKIPSLAGVFIAVSFPEESFDLVTRRIYPCGVPTRRTITYPPGVYYGVRFRAKRA